ncbi:MAG: response regulator [Anaerolineae bacterium]
MDRQHKGNSNTGTIMVVEDDPMQMRVISTALRLQGHQVVEAKDGVDALMLLDESSPDLIITDIAMPNINGLELLKALRSNPETEGIPFILATARNTVDDIAIGFQLGADDYLIKPYSLTELQARVSAKIMRPTVPANQLQYDLHTGLFNENAFLDEVEQEAIRVKESKEVSWLVCVSFSQRRQLIERFGARAVIPIIKQIIALVEEDQLPLEVKGLSSDSELLILIVGATVAQIKKRLQLLGLRLAQHNFVVADERLEVSALIGYTLIDGEATAQDWLEQVKAAVQFALANTRRRPVYFRPYMGGGESVPTWKTNFSNLWAQGIERFWYRRANNRASLSGREVTQPNHINVNGTAESSSPPPPAKTIIMVVEDDPMQRTIITTALKMQGHEVVEAHDGMEALQLLDENPPDLILSDINTPNITGLELLKALRSNPETESIPFILATARNTAEDISSGFQLGADDYLIKPYSLTELQARVTAKIQRPSVPASHLHWDRHTGLMSTAAFLEEVNQEVLRAEEANEYACLVCISLSERQQLTDQLGKWTDAPIIKQMMALAAYDRLPLEVSGINDDGDLLMLIAEAGTKSVKKRLNRFSRRIVRHTFMVGDERLRLTPIVGFVAIDGQTQPGDLRHQAKAASMFAGLHLDLQAVEYQPVMAALAHEQKQKTQTVKKVTLWARVTANWRTPFQIALTFILGTALPFLIYVILDKLGIEIVGAMYVVVVVALLVTSILIWWEGFLSLQRIDPPPVADDQFPQASAIIAAYLPNEAATIEATIEAFLRVDYPGSLQVILAYNSPRDMPIERVFKEIAKRDKRFIPFRVKNSTSKAQNVNAALSVVNGKFVGVFDADHHPDPDSFRRAWRWLANGYDIVQGHCLVRNGDASRVARTVAVEFEAIYAVSHPGRSRLHNFGIFGGSNGYWKTELLRETRMHGFMLTEDIDSSFRVISNGYKIANDPFLISRELATVTLKALWNQRMRWAQGWYQVTLVQSPRLLRSKRLTLRQKLGVFHLLIWREVYPWLSGQMIPIIAYWTWKYGGLDKVDWFVPIFVLTSILTMSTGPLQLLFIYNLADRSIRRQKRWLWWYLVITALAYAEFKNLIARVAQIKETMGERVWKVTARG